jgi:hypothetical protein
MGQPVHAPGGPKSRNLRHGPIPRKAERQPCQTGRNDCGPKFPGGPASPARPCSFLDAPNARAKRRGGKCRPRSPMRNPRPLERRVGPRNGRRCLTPAGPKTKAGGPARFPHRSRTGRRGQTRPSTRPGKACAGPAWDPADLGKPAGHGRAKTGKAHGANGCLFPAATTPAPGLPEEPRPGPASFLPEGQTGRAGAKPGPSTNPGQACSAPARNSGVLGQTGALWARPKAETAWRKRIGHRTGQPSRGPPADPKAIICNFAKMPSFQHGCRNPVTGTWNFN